MTPGQAAFEAYHDTDERAANDGPRPTWDNAVFKRRWEYIAKMASMGADPWEDCGEGVAVRRERGEVVEVRARIDGDDVHNQQKGAALLRAAMGQAGAIFEWWGTWEHADGDGTWYLRVRETP